MVDVVNLTPVSVNPATDYVIVHRRPADFDPLDPLKQGTIELVPFAVSGEAPAGEIDGGGPGDESTTVWDGGTP